MLKLVISGGQTGADRGGLIAACAAGLATGGWMPLGFLAHDGPRPDLAAIYGLREHSSANYPPRTRMNVRHSDATIRIARHWGSHGETLTLRLIMQYSKPWLDIGVGPEGASVSPDEVVHFLRSHAVAVLNVAGNSESTAPGIEAFASAFLSQVFSRVNT